MLRQFSTALKLYDRALDIIPNDPDVISAKAGIYQAQGNLEEADRFLSEIYEQTPSDDVLSPQLLRLERNYSEAIRLMQAPLAQDHFPSEYDKSAAQMKLALTQHVAGDTAGAKITAQQARNTLERLYRDHPDKAGLAATLSQAYALMGEKDSALKLAERAIMLRPRAKEPVSGPGIEENLAIIQTLVGENSRAISILTQLLQTPYDSWLYNPAPITPAFLRFDPMWDPLRADPAFQKLCEEKQPTAVPNKSR
jgi:tetratricopeptide (TPR) repeat protein